MSALCESSASVRPLRRWSADAIRRVDASLARVFADWAGDWGMAAPDVVCTPADALEETRAGEGRLRAGSGSFDWHRVGASPGLAWLGAIGDRRLAMRRLLAPDERPSVLAPLAAAMAESAWTELSARLGERLAGVGSRFPGGDAAVPPESDRGRWSGALVARCMAGGGPALWLHLAAPAVGALGASDERGPRRPGPTPGTVREALATQRTTLRAVLSPVTVDVGSLLALAPGDVLPLAHSLEQPLSLCLAMDADRSSAEPIAFAFLGARGRRRAVTLLRMPSKETP